MAKKINFGNIEVLAEKNSKSADERRREYVRKAKEEHQKRLDLVGEMFLYYLISTGKGGL